MRSTLVVCLFVASCRLLHAQDPVAVQGSVVFRDGSVYAGPFLFADYDDVVLIPRRDSSMMVMMPHNLHKIFFFDSTLRLNRKFIVIQQKGQQQMLEIVVDGPLSVLREVKGRHVRPDAHAEGYTYFVYDGSELNTLHGFNRLYVSYAERFPALRRIAERENLVSYQPAHMIRLVILINEQLKMALDLNGVSGSRPDAVGESKSLNQS